ncbi:hypothetical protein [Dactylosporangium sp. NPDC000521]|uniref:hypothetical protein n=1 Tax=Dactylosporangium sp. NPDC000521 TaxID=3363975 RepID=UPI0036C17D9E
MSLALATVVALAGSVACTGPAGAPGRAPAQPSEASAPDDWKRLGTWDSATAGLPPTRIIIPAGQLINLRVRCSGTDYLTAHIHTETFEITNRPSCDGRWQLTGVAFPPGPAKDDRGPYTVDLDGPATITSWALEAYDIYPPTPTPSG